MDDGRVKSLFRRVHSYLLGARRQDNGNILICYQMPQGPWTPLALASP